MKVQTKTIKEIVHVVTFIRCDKNLIVIQLEKDDALQKTMPFETPSKH
jgi:hypothetical protein